MSKLQLKTPYVAEKERVLDPSLLDKNAIDRLPQPTGWRLLVIPFFGESKSAGGIALTKETREREQLASVVAKVIRMGPTCYDDEKKYGTTPWCAEGDWIAIGRYAGARFKVPIEEGDKTEFMEARIINDDEVIATLLEPTDIVSFR